MEPEKPPEPPPASSAEPGSGEPVSNPSPAPAPVEAQPEAQPPAPPDPGPPSVMPVPPPPASPEPSPPAPVARPPLWQRLDRFDKAAVVTTAVGTLIRLVFVLGIHKPIDFDYSDMHGYIERAEHLVDHQFLNGPYEWYYPSGTSTLLSLFLFVFGKKAGWTVAAAFQGLASGLEIGLLYLAARRFFSKQVALGTAMLFAAHYLSISYAGYFLSENYLSIGLLCAAALLLPEKPLRCLGAGLALGLGAWAKSQAFLLTPLWTLVLLYRRRFASAALLWAGTLVVVVPVSVFVTLRTGTRAFISTNGGQTFALAHCPIREISYSDPVSHTGAMFTVPVLNQRAERGEVEASWGSAAYTEPFFHSGYYMQQGLGCIQRYPRHFLRMVVLHAWDTFAGPPWSNVMPWPDSHTSFRGPALISNLMISYLFAPLALLGMWWRRREDGMWYLATLPMLSTMASAVLFHGDPRFREPYDYALFLAAAAAIESWHLRHTQVEPAPAPMPEPATPTPGQAEQPNPATVATEP